MKGGSNTVIDKASKDIALNFFSNSHYVRIDRRYRNRIKVIHKARMSLCQKLICYKEIFGTGRSIAFIGPDGSGKTTIIDKLSLGITPSRKVYMGDCFFCFQSLYNFFMKIRTPYNRFVYLFYRKPVQVVSGSFVCFMRIYRPD